MGTRGLEIVRFRGRYYIRYNQYDSYYEGLGAEIIAKIPADPEEYQKWLEKMRAEYADKQKELEDHVYEIRDSSKPDYSYFKGLMALPSELPRLTSHDAEYFYIINLDREVLTMNFSIHWKLGHIPRSDDLWLKAIAESIYRFKPTISLDICPDEYIAPPALELPKPIPELGYCYRVVAPKTEITEAREVFLTRILAEVLIQYKDDIVGLGMEWSPDSFPFRELVFALVSIASGMTKFFSFPARSCNPRGCEWWDCKSKHMPKSCGFLNKDWAGSHAPLLEFGSMSHRPGDAPGVSPPETRYWIEDVLVSLTMRTDGEAVTQAVDWGIGQGRENFQVVVMSLFKVTFVEVTWAEDEGAEPMVKVSEPLDLSPLRRSYCMSTHPRERPELKDGMNYQRQRGEAIMGTNCTGKPRRLNSQFPGLSALVKFFEVAAMRRVASKSAGILPLELYERILDFVDYDTWKTCTSVSTEFRSSCLRKYRIDDETRLLPRPFVRLQKNHKQPLLSFEFENMKTGEVFPTIQTPRISSTKKLNWMPIIGSDRKALMLDVVVQFEPAEDIPAEDDNDDGSI
ncbi:hypothetical protein GGS24DRAFT_94559 [Hypoxylon argillaceum]|nr:hypothetical protein GGS24DRAFT_94559 [Hypoxylon argillaceum]